MIFNELMTGLNEAVGMESISDAPMTELEEMNAEIQEMVALESALDEEFAYNTLAFVENTEATNALLAMREVALESTQGVDPAKIYEGFGIESEIAMEAAKDVLARKAYAGAAAIKALIATCIKWLKSLFGVTVASKKVFSSLAKKGKAMAKELRKKQGSSKVNAEKLKRDVPKYQDKIKEFVGNYDKHLSLVKGTKLSSENLAVSNSGLGNIEGAIAKIVIGSVESINKTIEDLKESTKDYGDKYDKGDTSEESGSSLVSTLISACDYLDKEVNSGNRKTEDAGKKIKDAIKNLEDVKKDLDKESNKMNDGAKSKAKEILNKQITLYNTVHSAVKADLKMIVRVADDLLTMSKGVLAAIY